MKWGLKRICFQGHHRHVRFYEHILADSVFIKKRFLLHALHSTYSFMCLIWWPYQLLRLYNARLNKLWTGRKRPWFNSRYYPGTCLEAMRKTTKIFSQDTWSLCQDLKLGLLEYTGVPTAKRRCSVLHSMKQICLESLDLPHIRHGGGVLQFCGVVCSNPNLNGACPLGNHLVQPNFKQLIWFQRTVCQNHTIVEVIHGTTHRALHRTSKSRWRTIIFLTKQFCCIIPT